MTPGPLDRLTVLDRVQFGSPIGRHHGAKHPPAEAYVDVQFGDEDYHYDRVATFGGI